MSKNLIIIVAVLAIVAIAIAGYLYWRSVQAPPGTVGSAKVASEAVPEISTNAAEKVPEVNPLDRANPFKYTNPLR